MNSFTPKTQNEIIADIVSRVATKGAVFDKSCEVFPPDLFRFRHRVGVAPLLTFFHTKFLCTVLILEITQPVNAMVLPVRLQSIVRF